MRESKDTPTQEFLSSRIATTSHCLFCLLPLPAGQAVCDDDGPCGDAWWLIVPTLSGQLYVPCPPTR
jgi:hypothetical protein